MTATWEPTAEQKAEIRATHLRKHRAAQYIDRVITECWLAMNERTQQHEKGCGCDECSLTERVFRARELLEREFIY